MTETERRVRASAATRKYYAANREKILAAEKRRREENRGDICGRLKRYYRANREKILARATRYREENREHALAVRRRWREANLEKERARLRRYERDRTKKRYRSNPEKYRAYSAARRSCKLRATPSWVDRKALAAVYANCPPGYHVDHVYPLKGATVCGLHVPWNLQYLTPAENVRKSNRFPLTITPHHE